MAITFKSNQVFGGICLARTRKAQLFGTCWKRLALRSLIGLSLVGMVSSVWFLLCYTETITGNCFVFVCCCCFIYLFTIQTLTLLMLLTLLTILVILTPTIPAPNISFVCEKKEKVSPAYTCQ